MTPPPVDPFATGRSTPPSLRTSVVIPTHDNGPWLPRAVESVLAQSCPAHEIIVVDDQSTDDTPRLLAALADRVGARLVVLRQPEKRGPAAARNAGIARATGELVGFLDGDDAWLPMMIERQTAEFAVNPELGLCYSSLIDCDSALNPTAPPRACRRRRAEQVFDELYLTAFVIPTSTVFVRRQKLLEAGGFAESLTKAEDYECWLRLAMRHTVSCLADPLALRRHHPRSLTAAVRAAYSLRQELEAFELCGQAAARLGVPLPMTVADRHVLNLQRRLGDFLCDANVGGARLCLEELRRLGRLSPGDAVRFHLGRLRIMLRRLLGRV